MIPSEAELATRFGVSQGTVRKAIDEMAAENLLVRRQGKGTFVASHSDPRSVFRFLSIRANAGELPPLKSVPLECWRAKAGSDVARVLGIEVGASVIVVGGCCVSARRRRCSTSFTCPASCSAS